MLPSHDFPNDHRHGFGRQNTLMIIDVLTIITFTATLVLFVACVIIHYEGLHAFACWRTFGWKLQVACC